MCYLCEESALREESRRRNATTPRAQLRPALLAIRSGTPDEPVAHRTRSRTAAAAARAPVPYSSSSDESDDEERRPSYSYYERDEHGYLYR
jgi:hypothetical protein